MKFSNISYANAITHGGVFHADEVFGAVILDRIMPLRLARVNTVPQRVSEGVIVFDIGGGKFDHHQRDGAGRRENGVPYAACGLLWKEYGPKIVADTADPAAVWQTVDNLLIQGIDAVDNGTMPSAQYPTQALSVSSIISGFIPSWDSDHTMEDGFMRAFRFARTIFENTLNNAAAKARAMQTVRHAMEQTEGPILVLDRYVPWDCAVRSTEQFLFVVYPSLRGGWVWQCVPDKGGRFTQRKSVPLEWYGLNGQALRDLTGIQTASFVHQKGFIGGADTMEDTIAMAQLAISQ